MNANIEDLRLSVIQSLKVESKRLQGISVLYGSFFFDIYQRHSSLTDHAIRMIQNEKECTKEKIISELLELQNQQKYYSVSNKLHEKLSVIFTFFFKKENSKEYKNISKIIDSVKDIKIENNNESKHQILSK